MDDDDALEGTLPLTPGTAFLYENLLPASQRRVQQGVLSDDGEIINPLAPIAAEMAELHGVREPVE